jgi:trimethylamine:corrinoid methyltransferase-like protein
MLRRQDAARPTPLAGLRCVAARAFAQRLLRADGWRALNFNIVGRLLPVALAGALSANTASCLHGVAKLAAP